MDITLLNIKLKIENNMKDCYFCITENILKDKPILYEKKDNNAFMYHFKNY